MTVKVDGTLGVDKVQDDTVSAAKLDGEQTGTAPVYGARAFVNFDGSGNIRSSGNIASVAKNGTGDYTITFTTAMPDANYTISGGGYNSGTAASSGFVFGIRSDTPPTASAVRVIVGTSGTGGAVPQDVNIITFTFFR